jgi:hypothetical protein
VNAISTPSTQAGPAAAAGQRRDSVFGLLNLEWATLRVDKDANRIAASWARTEPALAGLSTIALIEQAKTGPVDARVDGIIAALVRRANATGADAAIAARVVLQLMLPRTIKIARTHAWLIPDQDEREQQAVCCMYIAIREHPPHITHHVPPYLAWRAHQTMRKAALPAVREHPVEDIDRVRACGAEPPVPNASEELAHVLAWAVAQRVISNGDADLLAARYGQDAPQRSGSWKTIGDISAVAAQTGLSPDAVRQRCSRATRRLAATAAAYLAAS